MGRRKRVVRTREQKKLRLSEDARELVPGYEKLKSDFELKVALDAAKRGIVLEYEPIKLSYTISHTYKPDFVTVSGVIVEAKGYFPQEDRAKMLAVKKDNPDLDIRMLFEDSSKRLDKKSKTTYGAWAEKNGFQWAEGPIPYQWTV